MASVRAYLLSRIKLKELRSIPKIGIRYERVNGGWTLLPVIIINTRCTCPHHKTLISLNCCSYGQSVLWHGFILFIVMLLQFQLLFFIFHIDICPQQRGYLWLFVANECSTEDKETINQLLHRSRWIMNREGESKYSTTSSVICTNNNRPVFEFRY